MVVSPGAIGAFVGATVLSNISTEVAVPLMSIILLSLGLYILIRFTTMGLPKGNLGKPLHKRFLAPLGWHRCLLRSDWIDASPSTQWLFYTPIIIGWAVAMWYPVNEYRKDRAHESADALAAEVSTYSTK